MGVREVKQRAVFFDRDGVLNAAIVRNGRPFPPTLRSLLIVPGAAAELGRLRAAGFLLFVITNQPDVARGTTTREDVEAIHAVLESELPLDEIFVCYHDDADRCDCRKPLPGLIRSAASRYDIDLTRSVVVGDRWRDIGAGTAAGCATIWLNMGYQEGVGELTPSATVATLHEAVEAILHKDRGIGVP